MTEFKIGCPFAISYCVGIFRRAFMLCFVVPAAQPKVVKTIAHDSPNVFKMHRCQREAAPLLHETEIYGITTRPTTHISSDTREPLKNTYHTQKTAVTALVR